MAQLVASMSGVVLGGVVMVVGSNLARVKIFTASIGSIYSLCLSGCLSGAVGSVDVWCSARRSCHGRGFESR